jgi:hypothetical protein
VELNKTAIIIVDHVKSFLEGALNDPEEQEQELKEIAAFSYFLDYCMRLESKKENIDVYIYNNGCEEILENFKRKEYHQMTDPREITKTYSKYLFCGFHLNTCIKNAIKDFNKFKNIKLNEMGIIVNLMMITPETDLHGKSKKFFHPYDIELYYWTRLGYKKITMLN